MWSTDACDIFAILIVLPLATGWSQQSNPLGGTPTPDSIAQTRHKPASDPHRAADGRAAARRPPVDFGDADSVVYRLLPASRLEVKTGKAGLFSFAGHRHVIHARAFQGRIVYYPKTPTQSHFEIAVAADSLQVLTPPDTAEIRKVTAAMRTQVLKVDQYHEITLTSRAVTPTAEGFHVVGALTLVGRTREVPIDVTVDLGRDSVRAAGSFSVRQTDFGIKPYSGGPGGTVKVADRVTFDIDAIAARSMSGTDAAAHHP